MATAPACRGFDVVTGALGYVGRYIAGRLLAQGREVRTLTGHPGRPSPFGRRLSIVPYDFDRPTELMANLAGAATLYNTYWIRFARGTIAFERAIEHSRILLRAARDAGVRRLVHISITNPSPDSTLPYFRGKAELEALVAASGLSYAVVRPTVVFGGEDILINNIAWLLRRFPVFAIPGRGDYRLQPVHVEDLAQLAITCGYERDNRVVDAVGPEVFRFDELVRLIARTVQSRARIVRVPVPLALAMAQGVGRVVGDVLITRDEIAGLMGNLLVSGDPPTGATRLSDWLAANADRVGRRYASELKRHYDRAGRGWNSRAAGCHCS
jgi:NADH dehydrogenase